MNITKEHVKNLSRQYRLALMTWLVESFQEDEQGEEWSLTQEQQIRIDEIAARMEQEGGRQITSAEFRGRAKAR